MASKRRNMFQKNKTQETTEKDDVRVTDLATPVVCPLYLLEYRWLSARSEDYNTPVSASLPRIDIAGVNLVLVSRYLARIFIRATFPAGVTPIGEVDIIRKDPLS
ncbi:hypothetical protein AAG570_002282 [Ranatra chinensis]|uniref:Uncharacterized protein n=1 Tax=Ranatra chinensis TaxID=642074 RepID=A0ABD0Y734_9HEMI